jgi:hypothetical protein
MALRPASAAVDLEQLPLSGEVANRHRLDLSGWGLRRLLALFRSRSTSSGRRAISLGIRLASSLLRRRSETANRAIELAIDVRQNNAIGIDLQTFLYPT